MFKFTVLFLCAADKAPKWLI